VGKKEGRKEECQEGRTERKKEERKVGRKERRKVRRKEGRKIGRKTTRQIETEGVINRNMLLNSAHHITSHHITSHHITSHDINTNGERKLNSTYSQYLHQLANSGHLYAPVICAGTDFWFG
jgi:hypothetical protein